jgi:hypothetical protein
MRVPGEGGAADGGATHDGPVRVAPARGAPVPRWRARAVLPALLCALAGGALSCFGDCLPTTEPPPPSPPSTLRPRYVLVRAGNQPLPAVLAESSTLRVRLLADTLLFTITAPDTSRGTFTETVVLAVRDAAGVETVSRTVSAAREWTRPPNASITLSALSAGGVTTSANATPFDLGAAGGVTPPPQLSVFTPDGRVFTFEAR